MAVFSAAAVSIGFAPQICSNDPDVNPAFRSTPGNVSCSLGPAGYVGIVGCLCWIAVAVTLLIMPCKKREVFDDGYSSLLKSLDALETAAEEPSTTFVVMKSPDESYEKATTIVFTDNGQKLV